MSLELEYQDPRRDNGSGYYRNLHDIRSPMVVVGVSVKIVLLVVQIRLCYNRSILIN